jgi:hypothetical protein
MQNLAGMIAVGDAKTVLRVSASWLLLILRNLIMSVREVVGTVSSVIVMSPYWVQLLVKLIGVRCDDIEQPVVVDAFRSPAHRQTPYTCPWTALS